MNEQTGSRTIWHAAAFLAIVTPIMATHFACAPYKQSPPQLATAYTANDKEKDLTTNGLAEALGGGNGNEGGAAAGGANKKSPGAQ